MNPIYDFFSPLVICAYVQPRDGEDTLCEMAHEIRRGDGGLKQGGTTAVPALGRTVGKTVSISGPVGGPLKPGGLSDGFVMLWIIPSQAAISLAGAKRPCIGAAAAWLSLQPVPFPSVAKHPPARVCSRRACGAGRLRRAKQDVL